MIARTLALLAAAATLTGQAAPPAAPAAEVEMWRLDCGALEFTNFGPFSDTGRFDGKTYKLVDSCYLIRHGADYMLWDTGLPKSLIGNPKADGFSSNSLATSIVAQLGAIGVAPASVRYVGISHYHDDHTGQVGDFPQATLLVGAGDWAVIDSAEGRKRWPANFAAWRTKRAKIQPVEGDRDIFGDGSVKMLAMPGHTPGHHALLVKLRDKGHVLLSGDQFHATDSHRYNQVPVFNTDRADTLASSARFREIAVNTRATVIIQHEPADLDDLPAFPQIGAVMEPVSKVEGRAYPWGAKNIDTDVIIPAHWLKTISRAGLGKGAFETVRAQPGNIFDDPDYAGSPILIAGDNFGCGSSREHAAWALADMGIAAVIAPSFSDIFSGNAFKNGIIPVVLPQDAVDRLIEVAKTDPVTIDLETMTVTTPYQDRFTFELDAFRRQCLMEGLDEIGLTLARDTEISAFERNTEHVRPWVAAAAR